MAMPLLSQYLYPHDFLFCLENDIFSWKSAWKLLIRPWKLKNHDKWPQKGPVNLSRTYLRDYQYWFKFPHFPLTHWGRVTHICIGKLTILGSDNGLSPGRRQAIIWTNAGIMLIGPFGTNFIEILIKIHTSSFKKMYLKISSAKWRLFCPLMS